MTQIVFPLSWDILHTLQLKYRLIWLVLSLSIWFDTCIAVDCTFQRHFIRHCFFGVAARTVVLHHHPDVCTCWSTHCSTYTKWHGPAIGLLLLNSTWLDTFHCFHSDPFILMRANKLNYTHKHKLNQIFTSWNILFNFMPIFIEMNSARRNGTFECHQRAFWRVPLSSV